MFITRKLARTIARYKKFPVIGILGPRQSGKTTLVRNYFKQHTFLSFEDPSIREFATQDPKGFLSHYENKYGIILDEFQYVPQILSYIQLEVDEKKRPGYFVLTGSQNFLMNQAITQSLAGRIGILTLLPLSLQELKSGKLLKKDIDEIIFKGTYPNIWAENHNPVDLYNSYIHSYVERDVRQLINIPNLRTFRKFLGLCAGRIGQLLNLTDIATNCGINVSTASEWLSILETSYVLFLLPPYFNNYNKRLVKTPKLYFYDTGLACNLLGIPSSNSLALSSFRGPLFENLIISDLTKQFYNNGKRPPLYFWRDKNGRIEVDCIIDLGIKLIPVEIKSSATIVSDFFTQLNQWNELTETPASNNYVVYGGLEKSQKRNNGNIISWQSEADLVSKITKE